MKHNGSKAAVSAHRVDHITTTAEGQGDAKATSTPKVPEPQPRRRVTGETIVVLGLELLLGSLFVTETLPRVMEFPDRLQERRTETLKRQQKYKNTKKEILNSDSMSLGSIKYLTYSISNAREKGPTKKAKKPECVWFCYVVGPFLALDSEYIYKAPDFRDMESGFFEAGFVFFWFVGHFPSTTHVSNKMHNVFCEIIQFEPYIKTNFVKTNGSEIASRLDRYRYVFIANRIQLLIC